MTSVAQQVRDTLRAADSPLSTRQLREMLGWDDAQSAAASAAIGGATKATGGATKPAKRAYTKLAKPDVVATRAVTPFDTSIQPQGGASGQAKLLNSAADIANGALDNFLRSCMTPAAYEVYSQFKRAADSINAMTSPATLLLG